MTGRTTVVARMKYFRKFPQREAELNSAPCELHPFDSVRGVQAIAGRRPLRFRENPEPLVVADGVHAHSGDASQFARTEICLSGSHGFSMEPGTGSRVK